MGAVDIPLIHVSVQWFRSQHPKPVIMNPEGPTAAPEIVQTLLVSLLAFTLLFFSLLLARYVVERLQGRIDAMRVAASYFGSGFLRLQSSPLMRPIRIVLLALFALLAAPAAGPSLASQATPAASTESAAPPAADAAQPGAAGLPRYTPPRTLRAYTHVFVAFAVAWVLLFGYVVFLARKFRRVEEQVEALARS